MDPSYQEINFLNPPTAVKARRLQGNSGWKHAKDVICSRMLKTHRSLPQGFLVFLIPVFG